MRMLWSLLNSMPKQIKMDTMIFSRYEPNVIHPKLIVSPGLHVAIAVAKVIPREEAVNTCKAMTALLQNQGLFLKFCHSLMLDEIANTGKNAS